MKTSEKERRIAEARRRNLLPCLISMLVTIANAWQFAGRKIHGEPQPPIEATEKERRFIDSQWGRIHSWHVKAAELFGGTAMLEKKGANFFRDVEVKLNYLVDAVASFTGDVSYTRHLKILTCVFELVLHDYIALHGDRRQPLLYLDQTLCTFCDKTLPWKSEDNLAVNQAYYVCRARLLEWPEFPPAASQPASELMQWATGNPADPLAARFLAFGRQLAGQA